MGRRPRRTRFWRGPVCLASGSNSSRSPQQTLPRHDTGRRSNGPPGGRAARASAGYSQRHWPEIVRRRATLGTMLLSRNDRHKRQGVTVPHTAGRSGRAILRSCERFMHRATYCAHTSPLPLLPSGPGGVGGITSRRTRHRAQSTIGSMGNSSAADGRLRNADEVVARYEELRSGHRVVINALAGRRRAVGQTLLGCVVLIAWVTVKAVHGGPGWPLLFGFAAAAALTVWHLRLQARSSRAERVLEFYGRGLERVRGERTQSGATGEGLSGASHLYERDLNLLGVESVFGLLDTMRTGIGQRGLAEYLLQGAGHEESVARQEAVRELSGRTAAAGADRSAGSQQVSAG